MSRMPRRIDTGALSHIRALAGAALAFAALLLPTTTRAQSSAPDSSVCLGFTFGTWTPALDWKAAGHGTRPDSSRLLHAPSGRDWAAGLAGGEPDSLLMLFPAWWPAGVVVDLPSRRPLPGDTVTGRARALIAYGDRPIPTARVRAWQVPCSRPR
jgi:hypothetical protein